jgi:hypothetical protein
MEREREREGSRKDKGSEAQNISRCHSVGCQFMNVSMFVKQVSTTLNTRNFGRCTIRANFLLLIPLSISTKSKSSLKEGIDQLW